MPALITIAPSWYPWLAMLIAAAALWWLWYGWKRGLLFSLLDLLSMLASLLLGWGLAWLLSQLFPIASWISRYAALSEWQMKVVSQLFWFVASFIIVKVLFYMLYRLAGWIKKVKVLSLADHLLGMLLSVLTGSVGLMILCLFLQLPFVTGGQEFVQTSFLNGFAQAADRLCAGAMNGSLELNDIYDRVHLHAEH